MGRLIGGDARTVLTERMPVKARMRVLGRRFAHDRLFGDRMLGALLGRLVVM